MTLHAVEDVDDALAATRALLWPAGRSRWLKLALVVLFVGGPAANLNLFQYNVPARGPGLPGGGSLPPFGARIWLVIGAVVAVALGLGLVFLLVGSIMEFVLVESLRHERVEVRQYWGERWRQGVRLFVFRIAVGLAVLGSAAAVAALLFVPAMAGAGPGSPSGGLWVTGLVVVLPVVFLLAVLVGLVNGFTTVFVVPIMVLEDTGILGGWGRLWPTIEAHPWQYLTYAVAAFVLSAAGGVVVAVLVGIAVLVFLLPFAILAAIGFALAAVVPSLGLGVLALVGLLGVLTLVVVVALAQVPVVAFLRYYALFVLGDIDGDLDLIPDRRDAIRRPPEAAQGASNA